MSTTPIIDGLEYPLCNAGFTDSPCVGVIGGFQDEQECKTGDQGCQNLKYGASSTIMGKLARLDKDPQCGSTIAEGAVNLPLGRSVRQQRQSVVDQLGSQRRCARRHN